MIRVFDRAFRPSRVAALHVVGTVRGPLGDERHVTGVRPSPSLPAGVAVIDASAASAS